jgi:hypothetical protein
VQTGERRTEKASVGCEPLLVYAGSDESSIDVADAGEAQ